MSSKAKEGYRIIIVNLDRRRDRWIQVEREMKKFSDQYERFSAIDTQSRAGCGRSHIRVLEEARDRGDKSVMILQDDIVLFNNSRSLWDQYLAEVPDDWDLIVSGVHYAIPIKRISNNVVEITDFSGLQMGLYNPRILPILKTWKENKGFDRHIGQSASQKLLKIYCLVPFLSIQADGFSDLRRGNVKDFNLFVRFEKKLCLYANNRDQGNLGCLSGAHSSTEKPTDAPSSTEKPTDAPSSTEKPTDAP